jgi:PAS domain S-box-containing protein
VPGRQLSEVYQGDQEVVAALGSALAGHARSVVRDVEQGTACLFLQPEHGVGGAVVGAVMLHLERPPRRQAEESAESTREALVQFTAVADAVDGYVAIWSEDARLLYANPRVLATDPETTGDQWEAMRQRLGESAVAPIRAALESTGRWSGQVVDLRADAQSMHFDVFRIEDPVTGRGAGYGWIGEDLTKARSVRAALRAANADLKQFAALVEASPDFIAIANMDGSVRYLNPAGRRMVGMPPDLDVTRTSIPDYLTAEGLVASQQVEQPAVVAQGHWEGESTLRHQQGHAIPVEISSFLMRDVETGEPFALATVQRDITERLAAEQALRALAEERQALLTRLVEAQDAERTRIAADVHDDSVQALAAVDLRLGLLRRRLSETNPELLDLVEVVQSSVSSATDRLRALLFDLEPPALGDGLAAALGRAAEEIFSDSRTRFTVAPGDEPPVPEYTRAIAYRIAKEALNNVRRHAEAREVRISVVAADGGLGVTVADDGVGLGRHPSSAPGHRGLLTMRDRATVAGGRLVVANGDERGTVVRLWLPGTAEP